METSDAQVIGVQASRPVLDESNFWKGRDGVVPFLDHPGMVYTAHRWERAPIINIDMTMHKLQSGQIGSPDLTLTSILMSWRCMTERQLRKIARPHFNKEHEIASRLRVLQKIGWFDGFIMDSPDGHREYIWMNGLAAHQYFSIIEQIKGMQDPISMLSFKDFSVALAGINEFRLILESRGLNPDVTYAPIWKKGDTPRPFSRFVVDTKRGKLTLYVERLSQKGKPLSFMRKKIEMYEQMVSENGDKLPTIDNGAGMVVWSVGSIQAIQEIVGSMDYIPDAFIQAFLCDECLPDFPNAFFLAQKGKKIGEVLIHPLQMDLL